MSHDFIEIDGAYGEGGGSILRIASAIAVLTGKSIRIFNIRKNRPKPGLKTQHLVGLKTLSEICNGNLVNGELGSTEIYFTPGEITGGTYDIQIGTAGSVGLLLQILQLACIRAKEEVIINVEGGGTIALWAPTLPYLEHVTIPQLNKMGYNIEIDLDRHGFYPKGGARAQLVLRPAEKLHPLKLKNFGRIMEINGISVASFHLKNKNVAKRQAKAATDLIKNKLGIKPLIKDEYIDALNPGSGICIWLQTDSGVILGSDAIGEKGKTSEKVGIECAQYLCNVAQDKATVDKFFSDQIIPFLALASDQSIIKSNILTNHTKTNIWLVEKLLGRKFEVKSSGTLYEIQTQEI